MRSRRSLRKRNKNRPRYSKNIQKRRSMKKKRFSKKKRKYSYKRKSLRGGARKGVFPPAACSEARSLAGIHPFSPHLPPSIFPSAGQEGVAPDFEPSQESRELIGTVKPTSREKPWARYSAEEGQGRTEMLTTQARVAGLPPSKPRPRAGATAAPLTGSHFPSGDLVESDWMNIGCRKISGSGGCRTVTPLRKRPISPDSIGGVASGTGEYRHYPRSPSRDSGGAGIRSPGRPTGAFAPVRRRRRRRRSGSPSPSS